MNTILIIPSDIPNDIDIDSALKRSPCFPDQGVVICYDEHKRAKQWAKDSKLSIMSYLPPKLEGAEEISRIARELDMLDNADYMICFYNQKNPEIQSLIVGAFKKNMKVDIIYY